MLSLYLVDDYPLGVFLFATVALKVSECTPLSNTPVRVHGVFLRTFRLYTVRHIAGTILTVEIVRFSRQLKSLLLRGAQPETFFVSTYRELLHSGAVPAN